MNSIIKRTLLLLIVVSLLLLYLRFQAENISGYQKKNNKITEVDTLTQNSGNMSQQRMSTANLTNFDSLPEHLKTFLYYRHCRHFPLILDSPGKCGGANSTDKVFLLLVIKSSPGNYERREVLRKTWAEEKQINGLWIRRVFLSGTTGDGYEKIRMNKLLEVEHQEHSDIIQWDFTESHCNLTLKQVLFMEWLDKNCPNAKFLFNGDDDVLGHTENMVEYLQSLGDHEGSRHLFAGYVQWNPLPIRDRQNKYFVPHEIYESDVYPPFCSGGGIILSRYTASVMYRMSQSIPLFPMDDVYLAMCLAKAGLNLTSHAGVKTFGLDVPSKKVDQLDPCLYKELLVVHRFLPKEMLMMWNRVHDPDLKCSSKSDRLLKVCPRLLLKYFFFLILLFFL